MNDRYILDERLYRRGRNAIALVAAAGWLATVFGYVTNPARAEQAYLVAFVFAITLMWGALFFVMLQQVTGSAWSVTMRRMAENIMAALPWGAALFVPVALSFGSLYPWARAATVAEDPVLRGRAVWMNPEFVVLRAAVYFAIWSLWSLKLYRLSTTQDDRPSLEAAKSAERWSAVGLPVSFVTVALASFDWLMSLDAHWFSTMFGVYVYAGAALAFVALLVLILLALRAAGVLKQAVNHEHYHDLGKWLFGLTVFWAYIAFSQYMLIWYANLPEETEWFRVRVAGNWRWVGLLLVVGHFLVPFLVLISRAAKRNLWVLGTAALWLLAMHYADLYWIVMPAPHWLDLATLAATGGTLALAFWARLGKRALAPVGDIRFERALEFENV